MPKVKKVKSSVVGATPVLNIDTLAKLIQDCTNRIPLIILGSGSSIQFKLPSMWTLGEHLKTAISFDDIADQNQFDEFKRHFERYQDLERTLLDIQLRPIVLNEIVIKTWELINKFDLAAYDNILGTLNDFALSDLISYLLSSSGKKVSIITTNYDRIAEYAASIAGGFICTGFTQNFVGLFSNLLHRNNVTHFEGYRGQVNIWKVHGSLDWFKSNNDVHFQFPMRPSIPKEFVPSIVTPGLSKYLQTHNEPFRTIFAQADNEIENATGYLCIGYGFNDEHVQPKLIAQIKNHKPIIVITKTLSSKAKELIIERKCPDYMLFEEDANPENTKLYSSKLGDHVIENVKYWQLNEYLNLIK